MQADELFFDPFYVSVNGITYPTFKLGTSAYKLKNAGRKNEAEELLRYDKFVKSGMKELFKNQKGRGSRR